MISFYLGRLTLVRFRKVFHPVLPRLSTAALDAIQPLVLPIFKRTAKLQNGLMGKPSEQGVEVTLPLQMIVTSIWKLQRAQQTF
jgi:hypothetical protein